MKSQQQLINNIIGQLKGISRMMDEKRDCLDILEQIKSAKSSLETLLNQHIEQEIIKRINQTEDGGDKDYCQILLKEIIKNN